MSYDDDDEIVIHSIDTFKAIVRRVKTTEAKLAEEVRRSFNEVSGKLLVSGGSQTNKKFIRFQQKGNKFGPETYNPDKIDLELCVPVAGLSKAPIDWELTTIEGHKVAACATYTGPYNSPGIKATYERLFAWLAEKGLAPIAPIREVYLHEPFLTPADMLETEIVCPLPDETAI